MPLPTCQCNNGLPVSQQLANIYCALYDIVQNGGGGGGGTPINELPVATQLLPDDVLVGNASNVTSQIPKNVAMGLRADLTANQTYDGLTIRGVVSAELALTFGQMVYCGNAGWSLAGNDASFPAYGMCVQAAGGVGQPTTVLYTGTVRLNAHGFAAGSILYLGGVPGELVSTAPVGTGECVQQVGFVIDANVLFIDVSREYVTLS